MKTRIMLFAAILLLASIAIQSCLKDGAETIVLEQKVVEEPKPEPEPQPEPEPEPEPEPQPEPEPNVIDYTIINGGGYFEISNSQVNGGYVPSGDCGTFADVRMNTSVLAGGTNVVKVMSEFQYDVFYVGIEGVDGYYAVVPDVLETWSGLFIYSITLRYSMDFDRDIALNISARRGDCVASVISRKIRFVQSQSGALSIVLTFDNEKDIDLHVITPSGRHIYFGDYDYEEEGNAYFGLDHDSNAGCNIDSLNNENVVIAQEYIEPGEYKVYVDLFSNCDPTIATKWFCTVRYNGELLENKIGDNPASGVYEIGAMEDYWDEEIDCNSDGSCGLTNLVMVFSVPTSKDAKAGVRLPEPPEIPLPKQCKERTKIIPRSK